MHRYIFHMPQSGEAWRHYKGGLYIIVGIATDTASGNPTVVYREFSGAASLYVRDLSVFLGSTEDHKRRFLLERPVEPAA
jgi:hypothetical protein